MADKCPNRNLPEWKQLTDLLGETGLSRIAQKKSHRMYARFDSQEDAIGAALQLFDTSINPPSRKYDVLTNAASKYDENKEEHKYYNKAGDEYTSVSRVLDTFEETKYRGEDTGSLYADSGTKIHQAFEDYAKGITVENLKLYFAQNSIPESFLPRVTAFIDSLKRTGIVLTETILGEDSNKIAGKPDIIHLRFDGSIDIYDFKTAYQTATKRRDGAKIWNPTGDYDGYKARRYTTQTEVYGRMVERLLGQAVSNYYIVPIEVEFKEDNPTLEITSINMLEKENVASYNYSKAGILVDKIFGEKTVQPIPAIDGIDDSTELVERLTGIVQYLQEDLDQEAERILTQSQFHRYIKGALHYIRNGKPVRLLDQQNRAAQKQQIIDEYLKQKYSSYKDIPNSILNYLATGDESLLEIDGKPGAALRGILKPFLKRDDVSVYALSDIKGFESKKNWIVLASGNNMSLLYVGNEELEQPFRTTQESNFASRAIDGFHETLFANLGIDTATASYELGSSLANTIADARKLEAGFIAMKLKEANPEMKFDRILIHSIHKRSITAHAADLREIVPIIEKMAKHPVASKYIPKNSMGLFSKPQLLDAKSYQPNFLATYLDNFDNLSFSRDYNIRNGLLDLAQDKLNKEELEAYISAKVASVLSRVEENPEAIEEARLLSEMAYQLKGISTELKALSRTDRWASVPMNIAHPIIQDLVKTYKRGLESLRTEFWQGYKKPFNEQLESFFSQSGGVFSKIGDRILSQTTRYYEPLFERVNYKVQNPDGTSAVRNLNSFSLIKEGSDAFLALPKHQQEMIVNINNRIQEAAQTMGIKWERGKLPLVRASFYNKFYRRNKDGNSVSYNELLTRAFESMEDNFGRGERVNQERRFFIENRFINQENFSDENGSYDGRKSIMGIDPGGFVNLDVYNEWETNLEVITDLFVMEATRMKHMNKVAGTFNTAEAIFQWQKSALFDERIGRNVDWVQWWRTSQLFNTDVDAGTLQSKFVNSANKAASIGLIAFKPSIAIVNLLGQQVNSFSHAIGNSFAGSKDFSVGDWMKAGTMVADPRNYDKISLLLQEYGLYQQSMTDLVNGHHRHGNKSIFRMKYGFGLMNMGDWFSRSHTLVAQMIHDGTWDAYTVENEKLKYDESKDGRFNGEKLDLVKGRALKDALKYQMERDGTMVDGKMTRAYDSHLAARIKGQADNVIGGFDRDSRGIYSFHSLGKFLGLFKTWLPARLNKGFSESYVSDVMGNYEFEQDENGNTTAIWKGEQMEGMMNTLLYYGWHLAKYRKSPEKLTNVQRGNLRKIIGDIIMLSSAMLLYASLPEDEDDAAYVLRRSVDDLISTYNMFTVFDFLYTPIAVVFAQQTLEQIFKIVSEGADVNSRTIEGLVRKVPVAGAMQEMYNFVEDTKE